jgi:hypothetical protein
MIHMKNFHFTIITLKDDHFHVDLSRFYKIASTCKWCLHLQNELQVDEILMFSTFKLWKP